MFRRLCLFFNPLSFEALSQVVSQRQAIWFLLWTLSFNFYEDGISTWVSGIIASGIFSPAVAAGFEPRGVGLGVG